MAYYLLNHDGDGARELMRAGGWPIGPTERHRDALEPGDLVLVYAAGPRVFVGRAEIASAADAAGVTLTHVEEWDPPVPMDVVLARIPATEDAKGSFSVGLVRITEVEHEAALAVAATRETPPEGAT